MIASQDRSGWIGASDTAMVMRDWNTRDFRKWWMIKLGLITDNYSNASMRAGTAYEHRILEHMGIKRMDRQIRSKRIRLRVNLDGEEKRLIHEVKTYGKDHFSVTPGYWMQCQVEMFATSIGGRKQKECQIDAYRLLPDDYIHYDNPIDPARLSHYPIPYSPGWIEFSYLPRLLYLATCLETGELPDLLSASDQNMRRKYGKKNIPNTT